MAYGTGRFGEGVAGIIALTAKITSIESRLFVGAAYNTVTDTWIRLGSAQGVAAGSFLGSWISPIFERLRKFTLVFHLYLSSMGPDIL